MQIRHDDPPQGEADELIGVFLKPVPLKPPPVDASQCLNCKGMGYWYSGEWSRGSLCVSTNTFSPPDDESKYSPSFNTQHSGRFASLILTEWQTGIVTGKIASRISFVTHLLAESRQSRAGAEKAI